MKRLSLLLAFTALAPAAFGEDYPADAFAICSACHLPDGVGVPGAFPPVRGRAAKIATLDGGRDYLVRVVSFGLMGTIEVDGVQYFGVMAGNSGSMSPGAIAAALNYLVFELNEGDATGIEPFTAEEVGRVQAAIGTDGPAGAGEERRRLREEHGEQWP